MIEGKARWVIVCDPAAERVGVSTRSNLGLLRRPKAQPEPNANALIEFGLLKKAIRFALIHIIRHFGMEASF